MDDLYFSVSTNEHCTLCIAPLTSRHIEASEEKIEDSSGYYLYEACNKNGVSDIKIIAKVLTEDAAFMLQNFFKMS